MQSTENKDILGKVKKLLALATSSNEHEASVATTKAQELLTRYNLTMQSVEFKPEYEIIILSENEPYLRPHQLYVNSILTNYFFVEILQSRKVVGMTTDGRRKCKYDIKMAGTNTNTEVAEYVFAFLSITFMSLWLQYKKANKCSEAYRISYYEGLYKGLTLKLDATKSKVESETGLIVVKDNDIMKAFNAKVKTKYRSVAVDGETMNDGIRDGKNINISKPSHSTNAGKTKLIG